VELVVVVPRGQVVQVVQVSAHRVRLVHRAHQVVMVQWDCLAYRVHKEALVPREALGHLEVQVALEVLVVQVHPVVMA